MQIIRITHEVKNGRNIHGLELKIENLEKIMFHPDVKEYPVVIISIAGSFRKGKSFLLGFFLKYLETQTKVMIIDAIYYVSFLCVMTSFCYVV